MLKDILLVASGGALGSVGRYLIGLLLAAIPYGSERATIIANIVGAFLIGLAISGTRGSAYLFCAVGFCGGFTTFSTFSSQALKLFQAGEYLLATSYIATSIVLSLIAVWAGCWLGSRLWH